MILDLAVISLFITNLFVLLYNNILFILNLGNKQILKEHFYFPSAVPEPYEIPLYLGLCAFFIIGLYLVYKYLFKLINRYSRLIKWMILIFLLLIFIDNLGAYPMKADYYPYALREKSEYFIGLTVYLGVISFFILQTILIAGLVKRSKHFLKIVSLFVIGVIAVVTFEARFPISPHDYSFFLGPIWEIVHGKTIYTQVPSQYGFISVLFLAILNKIGALSFLYLPLIIWCLYIVQYFLIFYIIYKTSSSVYLGLTAMFSIVTLNYFSLFFVAPELPQGGPMRWLPQFVVFLFLLKFKRIDSWKFIFFTVLVSLWQIDVGVAIFIAYFLTLFIMFLKKSINLKTAVFSGLQLIASLIFLLIIINLVHLIFGFQSVNFILAFNKLNEYAKSGYAMLPIEVKTHFWFLLFVYFASLIYFFRKKDIEQLDELILLAANFSLIGGIYYVGRSHPHNLFAIASLVVFNLFLLLSTFFKALNNRRMKLVLYIILFVLFIIYPANNRKEVLTETLVSKYQRLVSGSIFSSKIEGELNSFYAQEKNLIKNNLKEKYIIIIHPDDTYLLYLTQKGNLIDSNPLATIIAEKDLVFAVKSVKNKCPEKLAVDCRFFDKCSASTFKTFNNVALFVAPLLMSRLESNCQIKYQPVICTNAICIAQITR